MAPLVIWGASGHAKVLAEFLGPPEHELVALFDNDPSVASPLPGVPVSHGRDGFARWRAEHPDLRPGALVAIGGDRGRDRLELQRFLAAHGCEPIVAVHPTAFVARTARVGAGSHVLAQAALAADAVLGEGCILNTAASVDHECVLGDGVHVAPNATLAGLVTVGSHTLIGVGATVLPRVSIGADAVVGAGAVVTRDVPDGAVVVGTPARPRPAA